RFPLILELIAAGDLHLSALCEMRDFLTKDNHQKLLEEASRKTKRQVQELLARRFPQPEVPSTIRRLPAPASTTTQNLLPAPATTSTETLLPAREPAGQSPTRPVNGTGVRPPVPPQPRPRPADPQVVEPLSEDRIRLQLGASGDLKRKLELARDLMSHANPGG